MITTANSNGRKSRRLIPSTSPGGSPATWPREWAATAPASWSLDDWGVLEVVLSNAAGLAGSRRDDSSAGRPSGTYRTTRSRSTSWGSAATSPTIWRVRESRRRSPTPGRAGRKTPTPTSTCAPRPAGSCAIGWTRPTRSMRRPPALGARRACRPRSMPQRPFYFCSGEYYVRLVDELRPLTYGLVGRKTQADAEGRVGDHPGPFARRRGRVDPEHDLGLMKGNPVSADFDELMNEGEMYSDSIREANEHDPGLMKGTPMTPRTRTAQGKPSAILRLSSPSPAPGT